jgi:hypothetical protein
VLSERGFVRMSVEALPALDPPELGDTLGRAVE